MAACYYARAYYFFQKKEFVQSGRSLELAITYDPEPQGITFYKFLKARKQLFDELHIQ